MQHIRAALLNIRKTLVRIRSFNILGFKAEKRFANLHFSSGPTSIIYGPNGVGKTTLLQIMSAFFSKSDSILMANKVRRVECIIVDDDELSEHRVYAESDGESGYDWHTESYENFDKLRSLSIGVERGIAPQNLSINPAIIFDFLYRYSKNSRRAFHESSEYGARQLVRDSSFREDMSPAYSPNSLGWRFRTASVLARAANVGRRWRRVEFVRWMRPRDRVSRAFRG